MSHCLKYVYSLICGGDLQGHPMLKINMPNKRAYTDSFLCINRSVCLPSTVCNISALFF